MNLVEIILNSCSEVEKLEKIQGLLEACPDENKLKLLTEKNRGGGTPLILDHQLLDLTRS